jgi:hypothetical protein
VSVTVHAFPSLQLAPFVFAGFEQVPVVTSQVPASWHWSDAVHVLAVPAWHVPNWHVSVTVHAFPSLHGVPFVCAGFEHAPVVTSQVPALWHWSDAVQVLAVPAWHVPNWQVSVSVHAFPSLQVAPFVFAGFEQVPVVTSQVPTSWH